MLGGGEGGGVFRLGFRLGLGRHWGMICEVKIMVEKIGVGGGSAEMLMLVISRRCSSEL